jgi:hypothetical protein
MARWHGRPLSRPWKFKRNWKLPSLHYANVFTGGLKAASATNLLCTKLFPVGKWRGLRLRRF